MLKSANLKWLFSILLASLILVQSGRSVLSAECDNVSIPIIGLDLLKEVNDAYDAREFQKGIEKLQEFISLNQAQLIQNDEPLSNLQKSCISKLITEHRFRLAHFYQISNQSNKAEEILRYILIKNPGHYNSRLSLGMVQAGRKEYTSALYHLRFAMGGEIPQEVREDIQGILSRVNKAPISYFNLFGAIAPDTNINRATHNLELDLDINGTSIPFILDEESLATSGVGIVLTANGRHEIPLTKKLMVQMDGVGSWLNYKGTQYDDLFLRSQFGLRWIFNNASLSGQAILGRQWFRGTGFHNQVGGRFNLTLNLLSLFRYGVSVERIWLNHDENINFDGFQTRIRLFSTYQLSANSLLNASLSWTGKSAEINRFGYNQEALNIGYMKELPLGLTLNLRQYLSVRSYKNIEPFFNKNREDVFTNSFVQVIKRDWAFWGLVPVIGYGFSKNYSNIDLFSYTRHQVRIGFSKVL